MGTNKRPSKKTSKAASAVLRDERTGKKSKTSAGYALGDTPSKRGGKSSAKKSSKKSSGKAGAKSGKKAGKKSGR
jgi:hypothetical protein